MRRIIDIHSHILPNVDDGCRSEEEALEMLNIYEEQNVEAVICTPHFGPCEITGADVKGAFDWLESTSKNVDLYLGNEILISQFTLWDVRQGYANTMAGSKWVLIEFEEWGEYSASPREILTGMKWLSKSEFNIILAHPERYKTVQNNPEICKKIAEMGVKLQINAYDVFQNKSEQTKKATRYLLDNRLVSFIGSDAHGSGNGKRTPELAVGVKWIYDNYPEDYADEIVHDNAVNMIIK